MRLRFGSLALLVVLGSLLSATVFASAQAESANQIQIGPPQAQRGDGPSPSDSAEELERKGDQLRGEKAFLDALDYLRAASAKNPKSASLLNKIGIVQLQLVRYNEARKSFEAAIRLNHSFADAHNNLGVTYYLHESAKKAAEMRSGAPRDPSKTGDFGRAIKEYRKAIQIQEDSASFHSNLGAAYFARKDFAKASASFTRALELDPDVFEHTSRIGVAAQASTQGDRAEYFYLLAKMYAKKGATDRAISYLRRAMEEGYKDINNVFKDEEFAAVRKDPAFTALMKNKPVAISD
jgi:tetratricopeptide (TPR) repeat protein